MKERSREGDSCDGSARAASGCTVRVKIRESYDQTAIEVSKNQNVDPGYLLHLHQALHAYFLGFYDFTENKPTNVAGTNTFD